MITFKGNKALIICENGEYIQYRVDTQTLHQDIINDFCNKKNYEYPSEKTIIKNNHIYFRIVNDTVIAYLPNELTEIQLYHLELLLDEMDNLTYLGIVKEDSKISFKNEDIKSKFSNEIIQQYVTQKQIKESKGDPNERKIQRVQK